MIDIVLDLGDNVRFALLRNRYVVQYAEIDYGQDILDVLYSWMAGKEINRVIVNLCGVFADTTYAGSFYFDSFQKHDVPAFYLLPEITVEKVAHLTQVLNVKSLIFTTRLLCWKEYNTDAEYIDYADGMFTLCTLKGGEVIVYSCCTQATLKETVSRKREVSHMLPIYNMATFLDSSLMIRFFDNIFCISDEHVLRGLTKIALILNCSPSGFSYDSAIASRKHNHALSQDNSAVESGIIGIIPEKKLAKRLNERKCIDDKAVSKRRKNCRMQGINHPGKKQSDVDKIIKNESHKSDVLKVFWSIMRIFLAAAILTAVFFCVQMFRYRKEAAHLNSTISGLQTSLSTTRNHSILAVSASETGPSATSKLLSSVNSIAAKYVTIDVMNIVIQDGECRFTIFCRDNLDSVKFLRKMQSFDCYASYENGNQEEDGCYETIIFSI